MIDSQQLLGDLTRLLTTLEEDLGQQVNDLPDMRARLVADYEAARKVGRTRDTFETWIKEPLTQGAAAWILGTVFVRFLEDNALVDPMLSGIGARHTRAEQEHQAHAARRRVDVAEQRFQVREIRVGRQKSERLHAEVLSADSVSPLELRSVIASGPFVSTVEEARWEANGRPRSQCSVAVYEIADSRIKNVWYFPAHPC